MKALFETTAKEKEVITKLCARDPKPNRIVAVRTSTAAFSGKLPILGFEEEIKEGKRISTDRQKTYQLDWVGQVKPEQWVTPPFAYLIPSFYTDAIENLQRHGAKVEELREDIELDVEAYRREVDRMASNESRLE